MSAIKSQKQSWLDEHQDSTVIKKRRQTGNAAWSRIGRERYALCQQKRGDVGGQCNEKQTTSIWMPDANKMLHVKELASRISRDSLTIFDKDFFTPQSYAS